MDVLFPHLGIKLSIDRVAFYIGSGESFPVYWYGIIIALGFISGILMAGYAAKKLGEKSDVAVDLAIFCGPVGIVFARMYYCIFRLSDYLDNPLEIFDIRSGGLAIYGGIIGAVLAAWIYCRVKNKQMLKVFDIGAVGLITGQMIGRWGNFFNQEAFGDNTSLPWGMTSKAVSEYLAGIKASGANVNPSLPVHPTFLYESLWSLAILIVLIIIIKKYYHYNGQVFFAYAGLYGLGRFWIEGLRTDSLMLGSFRISQLVALISVVVFGVMYFSFLLKHKKIKFYENKS